MKKIFHIFLLIVFSLFVLGLGIFAYKLSNDALIFAFANQENQQGSSLVIAVDRVGKLSRLLPSGQLLDVEAIKKSLFYNDSLVGEQGLDGFHIIANDSFIKITPKNANNGDTLRVSSELYHQYKKTSYQLPSDVSATIFHGQEEMEILVNNEQPMKGEFFIKAPEDIKKEKILWYVYYPEKNESCFQGEILWDARKFFKAPVLFHSEDFSSVYLDIDSRKDICVLGGYAGTIIPSLERRLGEFSFSGSIIKIMHDDEYLQSAVNFSFSTPIVSSDILLNEKERQAKIQELFSKISFSPNIDFSENLIDISENTLTIRTEFKDNINYTARIHDIEDIYGREHSFDFSFQNKNLPFLAMKMEKDNINFHNFLDVNAKIFSIAGNKNTYEIKLCRLDVYGFSRMKYIYTKKDKKLLPEAYELLNSTHASDCQKSEIALNSSNIITHVHLPDFFDKNTVRPGFYVLAFRNLEDISHFENAILPTPFAINTTHIFSTILSNGGTQFFTINSNNAAIHGQQEMEIFEKIEGDQGDFSYATGSILGKTNENGVLQKNMGDFSNKEVVIISRSNGKFGYFLGKIPDITSEKSGISVNFFVNGEKFLHSSQMNAFAILLKEGTVLGNERVTLLLSHENGDELKRKEMISNDFGVIFLDFIFDENLEKGNYYLKIIHEDKNGKVENIGEKKVQLISKHNNLYKFQGELRFANTENFIPKHVKEKKNVSEEFLYYPYIYTADMRAEIIAQVYDEEGVKITNSPFEYSIFEEKVTEKGLKNKLLKAEGKGEFDSDGFGFTVENITFETFHHDKKYTCEIRVKNPKTQEIHTFYLESFLKIPDEFRTFDDFFTPDFSLDKEIIFSSQQNAISFSSDVWKNIIPGKYQLKIFDESSQKVYESNISSQQTFIPIEGFSEGVYTVVVGPNIINDENISEKNIVRKQFFVVGKREKAYKNPSIFANISEKKGEIYILPHLHSGTILLSSYLNGNFNTQVFSFDNALFFHTFKLGEAVQNARFLALVIGGDSRVELLDWDNFIPQKKSGLHIDVSLREKRKGEGKVAHISVLDAKKQRVQASIALRLKKGKYTGKTYRDIISSNNYILSGIFGDIFQKDFSILKERKEEKEENFQEEIFILPSLITAENGEIEVEIPNVSGNTDYSIEIIAHTKTGDIGSFTYFIPSKKEDFSLSAHIPSKIFINDRPTAIVTARNFTNTISPVHLKIFFQHQEGMEITHSMILNLQKPETIEIPLKFPENWKGKIPYTISLERDGKILSEIHETIVLEEIPSMGLSRMILGTATGALQTNIFSDSLYNKESSMVLIDISQSLEGFLSKFIQNIENIPQLDSLDILQNLLIQFQISQSEKYASIVEKDVLQGKIAHFLQKNIQMVEKESEKEKQLYILELFARLFQKYNGDGKIASIEMKKYFISHFLENIDDFSPDNRMHIILIYSLFDSVGAKDFPYHININQLSHSGLLRYFESKIFTEKNINSEELNEYFSKTRKSFSIRSALRENIKMSEICLRIHNDECFKKSFGLVSQDFHALLSLEENIAFINLALIHSEKVQKNPVNVILESGIIRASDLLDREKNSIHWEIAREKLSNVLSLQFFTKNPIFYLIHEKNVLDAPVLLPERSSPFLHISQKIEKVYESKGFSDNGAYRIIEPISENYLEQNALYKATISVNITNLADEEKGDLILKVPTLPGAEIFYSNNLLTRSGQVKSNFHQIVRQNNILLFRKKQHSENDILVFSYFFRPKMQGSYLLPGNFVYFIEGKEFFANSPHQYFHIQ